MTDNAQQPPHGYRDLVVAARSDPRDLVTLERGPGYAVVRINEPDVLNPLSGPLTIQLHDHLRALAGDESVRAVILTGADPAFSAGGDLRGMVSVVPSLVDCSPEGATAMWRWIRYEFGGIVRVITRTDKLFVAAVNGAAAGVGLAFALACDLVIASDRARLLTAFGQIGLLPEVGLGWVLTRRLGYHKTMELYMAGSALSGDEALALGLVNEVVPHDQLLPRAGSWCELAANLPDHALAMTKPLLRTVADLTWDQAIAMEEFAEPMCFTTGAHPDAVSSLLKTKPGWPG